MRVRLGLLAAGLALFMGCSDGTNKDNTTVVLRIEAGNAPMVGIDHIDLIVTTAISTFTITLHKAPTDASFKLPFNTNVPIPKGASGSVTLTGQAFDVAGVKLSEGSTLTEIIPGETVTLILRFGETMGFKDGGMADADLTHPMLAIDRTSADYAPLTIGSRSAATVFTVRNAGDAVSGTLLVNLGGANPAAFELASNGCQGAALTPGATCSFAVDLHPDAAGQRTATVTATGMPGGSVSATLTGTGLSAGQLVLTPLVADFMDVTTDTDSAPITFTATNSGTSATGMISVTLTGVQAAQYSLVNDLCSGHTLDGAATCTVRVRLHPNAVGTATASLVVAGTPGGQITAALSGRGVNAATLSVSPASFDFSTLIVGSTSDGTFTVTNTGGGATGAITAMLSQTGTDFTIGSNTCTTLAAGARCTVVVHAAPTAPGSKTASLLVSASPGGSVTVPVSGNALMPGTLTIQPGSQSFGSPAVGTDGETHVMTVRNTGSSVTGTITLSLSGTGATEFAIVSSTCTTLAAGGTCDATVRFHPNARGAETATLVATASPGGSATGSLTGTGTSPAHLTPDATTSFGTIDTGHASVAYGWVITNDGDSATGSLATVATGDTSQFAISNTCPNGTPLAATVSCTITITFTPTTGGNAALNLAVSGVPGGTVHFTGAGIGRGAVPLTVSATGTGSGTVTGNGGIACPSACTSSYPFGTQVTLNATNSVGSSFLGWSGACTGTGACVITMDQARNVMANFSAQSLTLTVTTTGSGRVDSQPAGISCGTNCVAPFNYGTTVTLIAMAQQGWVLTGWTNCPNPNGLTCTVNVTQSTTVGAVFILNRFPLTVSPTPTAGNVTSPLIGIGCGSAANATLCNTLVAFSSTVTLTATPDAGAVFTGWTGACSGTVGTTCTLTMPAMAVNVGATFGHRLIIGINAGQGTVTSTSTSPPSGGQISCSNFVSLPALIPAAPPNPGCVADYNNTATLVTLTAVGQGQQVPNLWGNAPGCTSAATPCVVTLDQARTVTVTFGYQVNVPFSGGGTEAGGATLINCPTTGGAGCTAIYTPGTTITVTATPIANVNVANWSTVGGSNGSVQCFPPLPTSFFLPPLFGSPSGISCTITVSSPITMTPHYRTTISRSTPSNGNLTPSSGGVLTQTPVSGFLFSCGTGCATYDWGGSVTVTATANTGFALHHVTGNVCGPTNAGCTVTMDRNRNETVTFDTPVSLTVGGFNSDPTSVINSNTNADGGSFACTVANGDCSVRFDFGAVVTLTPTTGPLFCDGFDGWDTCPGAVVGNVCTTTAVTGPTNTAASFFNDCSSGSNP